MPHTLLSNRVQLSVVTRGEYQLMSLWMGKKSLPLSSRKRIMTLNSAKNGPIGRIISRQLEFVEKTRIEGLPWQFSKLASENKLKVHKITQFTKSDLKSCLPFKHHFFKALIKQGSHKIFLTTTCWISARVKTYR